jgi:hypothetical protein
MPALIEEPAACLPTGQVSKGLRRERRRPWSSTRSARSRTSARELRVVSQRHLATGSAKERIDRGERRGDDDRDA